MSLKSVRNNSLYLKILVLFILIFITLVITLRGPIDNDYLVYYGFFVDSPKLLSIIFDGESLLRNSDHLYFSLISTFKQLDFNFISFLFVTTFSSIILKYLAARKFCSVSNSFLVIFLWLSFNVFTYEAMQIRYALAMGICFYALTLNSKKTQYLVFLLGFMTHMATLLIVFIFLLRNANVDHEKIVRNGCVIFFLFIFGRVVDYNLLPGVLSYLNFSTLQYLTGKLVGYLNAQDNTLSPVTMVRFILLYLLYILSVRSNCNQTLLNLTFYFFVLVSIFSGFSVFFGRVFPMVEFFSLLAFFSSVLTRVKQNIVCSYLIFVSSVIITLVLFYLAIKTGSFKLS